MKTTLKLLLTAIFAGTFLLVLSGCASTEPDNVSARPWNSPKGWESGLPTILNEGR
jgi:hypothetical protein